MSSSSPEGLAAASVPVLTSGRPTVELTEEQRSGVHAVTGAPGVTDVDVTARQAREFVAHALAPAGVPQAVTFDDQTGVGFSNYRVVGDAIVEKKDGDDRDGVVDDFDLANPKYDD